MIERHGLQEKDIGISELLKAEKIALMNAITGFYLLILMKLMPSRFMRVNIGKNTGGEGGLLGHD